jgi:bifunctional non-homologous end joining protein LigD
MARPGAREPLQGRRECLNGLIRPGGRIQYSDSLQGTPAELFGAAERMGLEGIVCKRRGSPYASGDSINWLKVKTFIETEYEILGVQRETGKPTMALMGDIGTRQYVGSAFVTFGRPVSEQFQALIEANLGPPPRDYKRNAKAVVQWLRPGMVGRVKHLRGEEKLRHARLMAFK